MTARRAIAIVRVSREGGRGDDLLSPDIQRGSITEYCERHGLDVVEWVEAIDESGSQERSAWWARLDAAVGRIEEGEADAIIAWKYSRVARRRRRWATAVDRVEDAGGTIESATEGIDSTTAGGRFARGMLAEVGAFFADQTGEAWKETHANRLSRGLPANGKPRFGYRYDGDAKQHRPDPVTGPVLRQTYTRYVAGESIYRLVRWLNGDGVQTVSGYGGSGVWSERTLRRVLDSGFGAGLLSVHDPDCQCGPRARATCKRRSFLPGVHDPVIDRDMWETYRERRRTRSVARSSERSQYLLSGIPRCVAALEDGSTCGSSMVGGQFGHARTPKFRCKRGKETGSHEGGYVTMRHLEQRVRTWLEDMAADLEAAAERAASEAARVATDLPTIERQLDDARADLERATRRYLADRIPESVWPAIRADLEGRVQALQAKVGRLTERRRARPLPQQVAATLLTDWDTLDVEHRRAMLRELIDRIEVEPGRVELDDRGYWSSGIRIIPTGDYRH